MHCLREQARSTCLPSTDQNRVCRRYPANWPHHSPLPNTPSCLTDSARRWYWRLEHPYPVTQAEFLGDLAAGDHGRIMPLPWVSRSKSWMPNLVARSEVTPALPSTPGPRGLGEQCVISPVVLSGRPTPGRTVPVPGSWQVPRRSAWWAARHCRSGGDRRPHHGLADRSISRYG